MSKTAPAGAGTTSHPIRGLHMQTSSYGDVIPICYGETVLPANIIWAGFFHSNKVDPGNAGGKKAGGFAGISTYIYTVSVLFCLGEGATPTVAAPTGTDLMAIGLMRPGNQVVSVKDAKTPVEGSADDYATGGKAEVQPLNGIEPGVTRAKRVQWAGTGKRNGFKGAKFFEWAANRFISRPGDVIPLAFPPVQRAKMQDDVTTTYAPEAYRGFATVAGPNENLGANASIPPWVFAVKGLKQFGVVEEPFTGVISHTQSARDGAPDHILADLLTNVKHGAGWERLAHLLSGYNGALADPLLSPFWNDGASSWGTYCRALGILISPRLDTAQPLQQILDDLALVTDTALVWSEGIWKMIPWGDSVQSRVIGLATYTFTPSTDPTSTYPGANIAIRDYLTLDDFLSGAGAKDDPLVATRVGIVPNAQASAGYFNKVRVEFENRLNGYVKETIEATDEAGVQTYGLIARDNFTAPAITRPELAGDVATRILQRFGQKRITYKFTVGWWFQHWDLMDVVAIPGIAIDAAMIGQWLAVRLTRIGENEKGELECQADPFPQLLPRAVEAVEPPPDTPVDSAGGVTGGGLFSISPSQFGILGPQYAQFLPPGAMPGTVYKSIDADATYAEIYSPQEVCQPVPIDMVFTALAVRAYLVESAQVPTPQYGFRWRLFVIDPNGAMASQPGLEVRFGRDDVQWRGNGLALRQTTISSKVTHGSIFVEAGSQVCIELVSTDVNGNPLPFLDGTDLSAIGEATFTATVGWEVA